MIRICNNEACYWSGPVDDTKSLLPHIHNLCPECGETTEEATASETEEYFAEWVTLLQREAADLRRQLERALELSAWHKPSEQMPIEFIPVVAYWQEDGAWNTVLYPLMPGLNDEGSRWYTHPDGSYRSAPVCWRYIPTPPGLVPDMVRDTMATQGEQPSE